MKVEGKIAVITGAASGIGRALARRFKAEGAAGIAVADMQEEALVAVANEIGALPIVTDVSREGDIQTLVERTENELGPIDIFCSNAGIAWLGGEDVPDADWQKNWDIHVMAHVYAARAVAPKMAARGDGYLINTASAAGLLSHVKHPRRESIGLVPAGGADGDDPRSGRWCRLARRDDRPGGVDR